MSWRLVAVLAVSAFVLVGCGSGVQDADLGLPFAADPAYAPPDGGGWETESSPAPVPASFKDTSGFVTTVEPFGDDEAVVVDAPPERPYQLDTGDRIRIFVYGQPNLSRVYAVDGAGFVSMPLIGPVRARSNTTYDLERRVANLLAARYVRDPKVSIEMAQYRPFFVLGEVRNSGQYPFVYGMTARTAVAIAGGYSPRANEREVRISRVQGGSLITRTLPAETEVLPGDTVYVQERWF